MKLTANDKVILGNGMSSGMTWLAADGDGGDPKPGAEPCAGGGDWGAGVAVLPVPANGNGRSCVAVRVTYAGRTGDGANSFDWFVPP